MKTATAEDEGLPIVFLDIDDVLCLNNPYGGGTNSSSWISK